MTTMFANPIRPCARAGAALLALGLPASPVLPGQDRPYSGRCSTVVTPVSESKLHIAGDCQLTHLGAATADTLQTVMPMGAPMMGMLMLHIVNDTTYRAANGDLLTMKFTGHGHVDLATGHVHFMGVESFTGGTGRFAAASGMASVEGTASMVTNVGQFGACGAASTAAASRPVGCE